MIPLLIAALIGVAPVNSQTAPTQDEIVATVVAHENTCINIITKKETAEEAIKGLELNTPAKRADFVVHCMILQDAFQAGVESTKSTPDTSRNHNGDN